MVQGEKRDSLMPVPDRYVIAQFDGINKALTGLQADLRDNAHKMGEIVGTQKAQGQSLKRLERRLETVSRDTQVMFDGLKETTGEMESQMFMLRPNEEKQKWLRKVFSEANVKVILWIILIILAAILGFKLPSIDF